VHLTGVGWFYFQKLNHDAELLLLGCVLGIETGARGMVRGGGEARVGSDFSMEASTFGKASAMAFEAAERPTLAVITVGTVDLGLTV
jgi:hypothetical protein